MRVLLGLLLLALVSVSVSVSVSGQNILNPDSSNTFHITGGTSGTGWNFAGASAVNPTLNMTVGTTYYISIEYPTQSHPFGFNLAENTFEVGDYGLKNNGSCGGTGTGLDGYTSSGTAPFCVLSFTPNQTHVTPQVWYHCTFHGNMKGRIQVNAAAATPTTTTPTTVANATTAPPTTAGNATTSPPTNATTPTTTTPTTAPNTISADSTNTFHVTNADGTQNYIFLGPNGNVNDPILNMEYGKTYTISIEFDSGIHPFALSRSNAQTTPVPIDDLGLVNANTTCGTANNGFTATATKKCTLTFTPPANTPQPLYYRCALHPAMVGEIKVTGLPTNKPGSGFALVPGLAALFAVLLGLFAAAQ